MEKKFINIIEPDFIYQDERGKLIQLVKDGYKQVNIVYSKKGAARGNHSHKINQEGFYIIQGKFVLKLKTLDLQQEENYVFESGNMFVIKQNVYHSFEFLEDTILISMYTEGVELENGIKDIFSE